MHFDEEYIWYMFVQGIDFRLFVCLGFFFVLPSTGSRRTSAAAAAFSR